MNNLTIRKAIPDDTQQLLDLYFNHLTAYPPTEKQDICEWRKRLELFEKDKNYHLLIGETESKIVSSVTLVIIENLTHNLRPYAIIENVVTHFDYRNRHFATQLMDYACNVAINKNCYKIMLLTGSKKESTLKFYENCGYNKNDKTAFIKWL